MKEMYTQFLKMERGDATDATDAEQTDNEPENISE